jgi:hypothetical protein
MNVTPSRLMLALLAPVLALAGCAADLGRPVAAPNKPHVRAAPVKPRKFVLATAQHSGARPAAAASTLRKFPCTPPTPSSSTILDRPLWRGARYELLGDVAGRLRRALTVAGYDEATYYRTCGGFVLATRVERTLGDGKPDPRDRFPSAGAEPSGGVFDLGRVLRALFVAEPGRFRLIVFVLTNQAIQFSDAPFSETQARALVASGALELDRSMALGQLDETDDDLYVLIYEFEKRRGSDQAVLLRPGMAVRTHLAGAKLFQGRAR